VVLSRVLGTIRQRNLVARGDRLLVAVSGGPDSTALLHGLYKVAQRLGITIVAACVDHGLRSESAEEAREVGRYCQGLGIACEILAADVNRARGAHISLQEAARNARLAVLEGAAVRLGCTKIALGHTADDQAETVLFRIVRGTGLAGLAGIPYQRSRFIRPLLDVRRTEILAYLAKRKIPFVTDPSNANRRYARSRIRHDVLPALAKENPRVVDALLALAHEAQGPGDGLWRQALPADLYLARPTVLTVERWIREGHGTRTMTVRDGELSVGYGKVSWAPGKPGQGVCAKGQMREDRLVQGPGPYRFFAPPAPGLEITPACTGAWPAGNSACFDTAKLAWPLCVRAIRPGDRMAPRGGRGTAKLSDLLIDAKIPRQERATLPLLCDATGVILYVPGLRPSQSGRPDEQTREWIEVHVLR
jgi:tRNA(Ile)-lysidine synthase